MPLWYSKPTRLVQLTWTPPAGTGIIGYNIYRSTVGASGPFSLLVSTNVPTSYTDFQVNPGQTYWYEVAATDGVHEGFDSTPIQVTVQGPP